MGVKRGILYCLCVLTLAAVVFHPGCRIQVGDRMLAGVYPRAQVRACAAEADRAAEEICRGEEAPGYTLVPVLCLRYDQAEDADLARAMLLSCDGVERLYEVSAGKQRLGLAEDPYVMEPIKEDYLASGADEHTAAAYLSEAVTTRSVLSCPEHADSPIQLSRALRESVDVIYIQTLDPGKG